MLYDVAIIGAGPVGLAAAIACRRAGLNEIVIEKGALVESIRRWPEDTTFFSEGKNIEIGGYPVVTTQQKPGRREAIHYYRKVAEREQLQILTHSKVTGVSRHDDGFYLAYQQHQDVQSLKARYMIVATGYFDRPNRLGVPGEELPHVTYHYREPIDYWNKLVTIVGGSNSAVENALDLYRNGARVTVIHRGNSMRDTVKYWLTPDFNNRVKEGSIQTEFNASVVEINAREVIIEREGEHYHVPTDFVLINAGFSAVDWPLRNLGAEFDGDKVVHDAQYETTVPGLFIAGSAGFGRDTRSVFIENGREHAQIVAAEIARRHRDASDQENLLKETSATDNS